MPEEVMHVTFQTSNVLRLPTIAHANRRHSQLDRLAMVVLGLSGDPSLTSILLIRQGRSTFHFLPRCRRSPQRRLSRVLTRQRGNTLALTPAEHFSHLHQYGA